MRNLAKLAALCVGAPLMAILAFGCDGVAIANLIEERQGNVLVQVINNTPFRALLTVGVWDDLDRNPPSDPQVQQQRIEPGVGASPLTLQCRKNLALNTARLLARIRDTGVDRSTGLDENLLNETIFFSAAPTGSAGEELPTAGTAEGIEVLLGVDYTCEDLLIFTLVEDADAPGGFRVEYRLVQDEENDV